MRKALVVMIVVAAVATLGCEDLKGLVGLENNNARIRGVWHKYSGGFRSDQEYEFESGIIKQDGFAYGTYEFVKSGTIDVSLGEQAATYTVEFVSDDEMVWSEDKDGQLYERYRWKRQ